MGRRTFGRTFKLEAYRLVKERGGSPAQASRDPADYLTRFHLGMIDLS